MIQCLIYAKHIPNISTWTHIVWEISLMQCHPQTPYQATCLEVREQNISQTKLKSSLQGLLNPSEMEGDTGGGSMQGRWVWWWKVGGPCLQGCVVLPGPFSLYHVSLPHWWCGCKAQSWGCSKGDPRQDIPGTRTHSHCIAETHSHLLVPDVAHALLCWTSAVSCICGSWIEHVWSQDGTIWSHLYAAGLGETEVSSHSGMTIIWLLQFFWSISNIPVCSILFSINSMCLWHVLEIKDLFNICYDFCPHPHPITTCLLIIFT